ncbi:MAG TPA: phenylalanine--tRNA ligase subunit beta [Bacillota bacterium]|nr:phenylalanine--tRNA ligase subunit beta [Bacillota bacterium]
MQITYKWLEEYVESKTAPQTLAEALTAAGVAVDSVVALDRGLHNARVGRITEVGLHPNAEKLLVCQLDMGDANLQIVTGAPNVKAGDVVPVAVPGTVLPDGRTIDTVDFRGVMSQGMLLSPDEMCIDRKTVAAEMRDGILILPEETALGTDVVLALGLDDYSLEFDLTPNRADCLSVAGVAWDVAAIVEAPFSEPASTELDAVPVPQAHGLKVSIIDEELCPGYLALVVEDVKIAQSPLWLQNRLRNVGHRPINNIVDLTNLVMLESGQPLHAFDLETLAGQEIIVRPAAVGEKIITLDGVERTLPADALTIADSTSPVAIAGIMGGLSSEVGSQTRRIVVESAWFALKSIRRTSRAIGLRTDASARFDKGIDPAGVQRALCRMAYLIEQMGIGTVKQPLVGVQPVFVAENVIDVRPQRVNQLLGLNVTAQEMSGIFSRLGFTVEKSGENLRVRVPSRRRDIVGEVDLVEEVGRIRGMDKIPTLAMEGQLTQGGLTDSQRLIRSTRSSLVGMGLNEIMTLSFFDPAATERFLLPTDHPWRKAVPIVNPLSSERGSLRPALTPAMVEVLAHNQARQVEGLSCFEISKVFLTDELPLTTLPREELRLALGCFGSTSAQWSGGAGVYDFFYLKGIIESLGRGLRFSASQHSYLHPGRQASVMQGDHMIGFIGELHPRVAVACGIKGIVQVAELDFFATLARANGSFVYTGVPRYLPAERDMSFVLDETVPAVDAVDLIKTSGGEYLRSVRIFDIYQGANLPTGKRSLAFRLEFVNLESTMTEDAIARATSTVEKDMERVFGAKLRR